MHAIGRLGTCCAGRRRLGPDFSVVWGAAEVVSFLRIGLCGRLGSHPFSQGALKRVGHPAWLVRCAERTTSSLTSAAVPALRLRLLILSADDRRIWRSAL